MKLPLSSELSLSKNPPDLKPAASSSLLGVLAILLGLLGSVCVGVQVSHLIDAFFHGEVLMPSRDALVFMVATVLGSVVLAFIRDSQNPAEPEDSEEVRLRLWPFALGLLLIPTAVAWIQFELFFETVYMFPLLSFIGGVLWSSRFSGVLPPSRFRRTLTFFLIMTVGVPLGTFAATVPTNHFQRHGTGVVWISGEEYEEEIYMEADDDETLGFEVSPTLTDGLLEAVVSAKQVEVVEKDGKTFVRLEDGTLQAIEVEEFDWEKAQKEAEAEQKERRELRREVLRKRNEERRNGGRIFSTP